MPSYVNWNYPTNILVGAGSVAQLPFLCDQYGLSAPLIVSDPGIVSLPFYQGIQDLCLAHGLRVGSFSQVKPNPTGENVEAGIIAYREGKHDGVITLGGGSAVDTGKTIAVMANQACQLWELEDKGDNWQRANEALIAPVIAIPTTAGTGSEVGRAALIVNEADQRKVIVFHPKMLPVSVILDPEITTSLPPHLTAATGMDALSHNLEAFCSPLYHPMAEGIAIEGIRLVKDNLARAVHTGHDLEARQQMLVASMMGATAFQRGLGAMHALAHPLGAVFDAHHGLLNAVLMPYVLSANRIAIESRISRLAVCIGLPPDFDAFLQWLLALRADIGIPHQLSDFITRDNMWNDIGRMATLDPSGATNPIPFSGAEYQHIADLAYEGNSLT